MSCDKNPYCKHQPLQLVNTKSMGALAKIDPIGDPISTSRVNGVQVIEKDDENEWEGFDTLENNGVVKSEPTNLESGPSLKKNTRKLEPAIRKNVLRLQKNELSIRKDEALAGNSFKLLEGAVNDEVDGIVINIL